MTVNPGSVFAPYDHSSEVTSHPAKSVKAPGSIQSQLNSLKRRVAALEEEDKHSDGSGNNREPGPNAESLGRGAASGGANN